MSDLNINAINTIGNYNKMVGMNLPNAQGINSVTNFENILQEQNNIISQNFNNAQTLSGNISFDEKLFDKIDGVKATDAAGNTLNGFGKALSDGLKSVNDQQVKSQNMTMAFASGEDISIHEVMLESQKASLNLALATQMRNKLLSAYNEIYSMNF